MRRVLPMQHAPTLEHRRAGLCQYLVDYMQVSLQCICSQASSELQPSSCSWMAPVAACVMAMQASRASAQLLFLHKALGPEALGCLGRVADPDDGGACAQAWSWTPPMRACGRVWSRRSGRPRRSRPAGAACLGRTSWGGWRSTRRRAATWRSRTSWPCCSRWGAIRSR